MNYDCKPYGMLLNHYKPEEIGKYIRLSLADINKPGDESESVSNQRRLMNEFITRNGNIGEKCREFVDDGVSGTTFDRPEYKRMFKDIVDGQVNTVIVKDLSRFGRNHIQSDDYIENILPGYNVRFISIIDEIDSLKKPSQ